MAKVPQVIEDKVVARIAAEAKKEAYEEIFTHLQGRYLSDELKDPDSPDGRAILTLARELGELLRSRLQS